MQPRQAKGQILAGLLTPHMASSVAGLLQFCKLALNKSTFRLVKDAGRGIVFLLDRFAVR